MGEEFDFVQLEVPVAAGLHTFLSINQTTKSGSNIDVTGQTTAKGVTVTGTLTPLNANGTPRPAPAKPCTKTFTEAAGSNTWTFGFIPSDVTTALPPPPLVFSGLYKFEASAPGEGTVSESITVP
jgi:hypothetical protein